MALPSDVSQDQGTGTSLKSTYPGIRVRPSAHLDKGRSTIVMKLIIYSIQPSCNHPKAHSDPRGWLSLRPWYEVVREKHWLLLLNDEEKKGKRRERKGENSPPLSIHSIHPSTPIHPHRSRSPEIDIRKSDLFPSSFNPPMNQLIVRECWLNS